MKILFFMSRQQKNANPKPRASAKKYLMESLSLFGSLVSHFYIGALKTEIQI
jgi:hypothetical protein